MKSSKNCMGILILRFLTLGFLFWVQIYSILAAEGLPEQNSLSIRVSNEPLREVLKKISEASGYEIRFNTEFADEKISIQLDNVNLNETLARVLKAYNHMSLWDDANHIVTLLIFKDNGPPVTLSGMNRIFELATETTAGP